MARIDEKLKLLVLSQELVNIWLEHTPQYDPYEDKTQNEQSFFQLEEEHELTPGVAEQYTGAEILMPRWDQMARDHVVAWNDHAKKMFWLEPIQILLDTNLYQVEFTAGDVTGLTTNFFAESMYALCDVEEIEYLF